MSIGYFIGETEELRELVKSWQAEQNGSNFGLDLRADNALAELEEWRKDEKATIIVQAIDDKILGFLCIFYVDSLLVNKRVAVEKFWYVLPEHRRSGVHLISEARKWAKDNQCSHLIMVASNLASDMYLKVCNLFGRLGMEIFETTFISEI